MKTFFNWVYAFIIGGAFGYSGYRILIGLPLPAPSRSKNQWIHQVEVFLLEKLGPEILGTAFIVVGLLAALYIVRPKKAASDIRAPQKTNEVIQHVEPHDYNDSYQWMVRTLKLNQRKLTDEDWQKHQLTPPDWLVNEDDPELLFQYREQDQLLRWGTVAWGSIVQANQSLFDFGPADHPAMILFSDDRYMVADPYRLRQIGEQLFAAKGRDTTPDAQQFADMLQAEYTRVNSIPLPDSLTNGRPVFITTLMIPRSRLPEGYLKQPVFPVIIDRTQTPISVTPLPIDFWSEKLIKHEWS